MENNGSPAESAGSATNTNTNTQSTADSGTNNSTDSAAPQGTGTGVNTGTQNNDSSNTQKTDVKPNLKKLLAKGPWGEKEVELDLNDDKALLKYIQNGLNAQNVTEATAKMKKELLEKENQLKSIVENASKDRKGLLKHFNVTKDEMYNILAEIEAEDEVEASLSPEARELKQIKSKLAQEEQEKLTKQQKEQQEANERSKSQKAMELGNQLIKKLTDAKVLKTIDGSKPSVSVIETIEGVGKILKEMKEDGIEPSLDDAYEEYAARRDETVVNFINEASIETLFKVLEKRLPEINQTNLEMLGATSKVREERKENNDNSPQQGKRKSINYYDFLKK